MDKLHDGPSWKTADCLYRSSGRQELLWREGVEHLPKEGAGHLPREGTEHLPTPLAAPWEGGKEAKEAKEGSNGGRREERLLPLFSLSTGSTSSRTNLVSQVGGNLILILILITLYRISTEAN